MDDITPVRPSVNAEPARLSYAQKRDLAGIAASAVLSTVLMAAPMVGPLLSEEEGGTAVLLLASRAVPRTAALPQTTPIVVIAPANKPARAAARRRENVRTGEALQVARLEPARKPLSRRLTGLFTGDGTYTVRPFPTLPASRH